MLLNLDFIFLLDGSEGSRQSPNKTEVFFVAPGDRMEGQVPPAGVMRPIIITASADSVTSSAVSERSDVYSDEEEDEDFCIIDDAGLGISVSFYIYIALKICSILYNKEMRAYGRRGSMLWIEGKLWKR